MVYKAYPQLRIAHNTPIILLIPIPWQQLKLNAFLLKYILSPAKPSCTLEAKSPPDVITSVEFAQYDGLLSYCLYTHRQTMHALLTKYKS